MGIEFACDESGLFFIWNGDAHSVFFSNCPPGQQCEGVAAFMSNVLVKKQNKKISTQPPDIECCNRTWIRRQRMFSHSAPELRKNLRFVVFDDLKILKWWVPVKCRTFYFLSGTFEIVFIYLVQCNRCHFKKCMFLQWGRQRKMFSVMCVDPSGCLKYTLKHEEL